MKGNQVRLEKLAGALTPKQAFLLWMEEAHQYQTVEDYARSIKGGPESAWPLVRLPEQVTKAVEQAMKGEPKEQVRPRVRQALRDVLFLFHLHQQVNRTFLERERCFWAMGLALATGLNAMIRERNLRDQMRWNSIMVALELPYPVDPETAVAIDAAKEHYVLPWEVLEEGDEVTGWVLDHFVAQGKTALPDGAYRLLLDGARGEDVAMEEVRESFQDPADFEKFLAREDFSYALADVPDAEFLAHYESIVLEMKGKGLDGQVVELETVPHAFLRDAPLVEGQWIDAYVVALAEWGARLVQKGYVLKEPQDGHPFAWYRVINQEGSDVGNEVQEKLWEQTKKHLAGFPGSTREVGGRLHLRWSDYLKWRGRRVKGDLELGLRTGLVVAKWNQWVELATRDGLATVSGMKVCRLDCHANGYGYQVSHDGDELAEALRRRKNLLVSIDVRKTGNREDQRLRGKAKQWRDMAEDYLGEMYALQITFDSIKHPYFDGQPGLFPGSAHALSQLVEQAEKLVNSHNHNLAAEFELMDRVVVGSDAERPRNRHTIDLSKLQGSTQGAATDQAAYLVDMAKAEALDAMGGAAKAIHLVDRHI